MNQPEALTQTYSGQQLRRGCGFLVILLVVVIIFDLIRIVVTHPQASKRRLEGTELVSDMSAVTFVGASGYLRENYFFFRVEPSAIDLNQFHKLDPADKLQSQVIQMYDEAIREEEIPVEDGGVFYSSFVEDPILIDVALVVDGNEDYLLLIRPF